MSGLVEDLRQHHDRLNCRIEEISGTRFKTDSERDSEIELAMSLCWKAADEITRLTARVAELEGALRPFAEIETSDGMPDGFLRTPDGHAVVFNGLGKDFKIAVTVGDVRRARTALEPKP